jgi:hypothetical protein
MIGDVLVVCYCGMLINSINIGEKITCSKCYYGDWIRIAEWNVPDYPRR